MYSTNNVTNEKNGELNAEHGMHTSTPKRKDASGKEKIILNNVNISDNNFENESTSGDGDICNDNLDDSCFNLNEIQELDVIMTAATQNINRKSPPHSDSPLSSKKPLKIPRFNQSVLLSPSQDQEKISDDVENLDDTTAQLLNDLEERSQVTSDLNSILLSNAQKSVKPTSGRRMLSYNEPSMTPAKTQDLKPIDDTSMNENFFGLPKEVKPLIRDFKDIEQLYQWQEECLNLEAIKQKKNLIYSLPTSGGKTLVAEILILQEILCHKKNAIFILPYVSLVQEKVRSLSPFALALGFLVEEYAGGRGSYPPRQRRWKQVVYVATIEKALGLVNSLIENQRLSELGLAVIDELHMIGESGRGATLETLLTRLMFANAGVQLVGMSATIGNMSELSRFLHAETYTQDFRPVELKEYVKLGQEMFLVPSTKEEELVTPCRKFPPVPPKAADLDQIGLLVGEVIPESSVLVFCATKLNCENVAQLVCQSLNKTVTEHKRDEKKALFHALIVEGSGSVCSILKRTLPYGVAYHHSGLTMSERNLLEEGYRAGVLCCLCCTSTLAAGVNLPAKRVILRSPRVGREFLSLSQYKQMVGRAGRAGMDTEGESILICQPEEMSNVRALLGAHMNECVSQLYRPIPDGSTSQQQDAALEGLVLSSVGLGQTHTASQVIDLANCSLLAVQAERLNVDVKQKIVEVIDELSTLKVFSPVVETQETCQSVTEARLGVSSLGKAAMRAHLTVARAQELQSNLAKAQGSLNLLTPLHLLFVVTPPDLADNTRFSPIAFCRAFKSLPYDDQKTVFLVGVTEGNIATMERGAVPRSVSLNLLKRVNVALLLRAAWKGSSVWDVALQFELPRGDVQTLMSAAAAFASNVQHFCQELPELFWCYSALLLNLSERLAHCCSAELLPLMELPAVKKGRARQLYDANYKTLNDVASADPYNLSNAIQHLPLKVARHIISTAHILLLERAESLREDAEVLLEGVQKSNVTVVSGPSTPGTPKRSTTQMPLPHISWASPHLSPRISQVKSPNVSFRRP